MVIEDQRWRIELRFLGFALNSQQLTPHLNSGLRNSMRLSRLLITASALAFSFCLPVFGFVVLDQGLNPVSVSFLQRLQNLAKKLKPDYLRSGI